MRDMRIPKLGERIDVGFENHHVKGIVTAIDRWVDGTTVAMIDDSGQFGQGVAWVSLSKAESIRFYE